MRKSVITILFFITLFFQFPIEILSQDKETQGPYSPIIETISGDIQITYPDIPMEVIRKIVRSSIESSQQPLVNSVKTLDRTVSMQNQQLDDLSKIIEQQIATFRDLTRVLQSNNDEDEITKLAKDLLNSGKLKEAQTILREDAIRRNEKAASRNYETAKASVLNLEYQEALRWYAAAALLPPPNFEYLYAYASHLKKMGKYDLAVEQFNQALDIAKNSNDSSNVFLPLGSIWEAKGKYDQAINYYNLSLAIDTVLYGYNHRKTTTALNNLGTAWTAKGYFNQALRFYSESARIDSIINGNNSGGLASTLSNMGNAFLEKRDYYKALELYKNSLKIRKINSKTDYNPELAVSYNNIGDALSRLQKHDSALYYLRKAVEIDIHVFGKRHPRLATEYNNIGSVWSAMKNYDSARYYMHKSLAINLEVFGDQHPKTASYYNNIGTTFSSEKIQDSAIWYFKKALEIDTKTLPEIHPNISMDYSNLGHSCLELKKYDTAIFYFQKALTINSTLYGDQDISLTIHLYSLGLAYQEINSFNESIKNFKRSASIYEKSSIPDQRKFAKFMNLKAAEVYNLKGMQFYNIAAYDSAVIQFQLALINSDDSLLSFKGKKPVINYYNNMGGALRHLGRFEEGLKYLNEGFKLVEEVDAATIQLLDQFPDSLKSLPRFEIYKKNELNTYVKHRILLHKLCIYKALDRNKEHKELFQYLKTYAKENDDERMFKDLEECQ